MECSSQDYVPETVNLREYCELIQYGFTQSASEAKIGPKFLRITDIQKNPVDWSTVPYCEISKEDFRKYLLEPGDIVIARTGASTGTSAIYKENMPESVFASYLIRIRPTAAFLPDFVYYFLQSASYKEHVKSIVGGSAQPNANAVQLTNVQIPLMTIEAQKQVCKLLGCLDNNISTNIEMSKTLEEIARAIFKHWFIDFEFPNENGEPYKSSGGEMIDSPLGPIPKGWRVGNISDIANILGGGTQRTSIDEYWDGDIPFFTPKDAKSLYCIHTEKCLTKKGLQSCSSRLYEKNTVFITARGTVGKLALAGTPMAMNQSCYALTGKEVSQYFLYFAIDNLVDSLKQSSHGAVFSTITTATLESTKALIPEARMERNFRDRIASFFEIMLTNDEENGKLSKLRDALLPKLMSGEIRVTDIEDKLGRGSNAEST